MRKLAGVVLLLAFTNLSVARPDSMISTASSTLALDLPAKAHSATDPLPVVVSGILEDGLEATCSLTAIQKNRPRKNVKARFTATLSDALTGETLVEFGTAKSRTDEKGVATVAYKIPAPGNFAQMVALTAAVDAGGGKRITGLTLSCSLVDSTL